MDNVAIAGTTSATLTYANAHTTSSSTGSASGGGGGSLNIWYFAELLAINLARRLNDKR